MLKNQDLRIEVIQLYHNILVIEHRERYKIIELVTRKVMKNIGKYVKRCNLCQRIKNRTETLVKKLIANQV